MLKQIIAAVNYSFEQTPERILTFDFR